MLQSLAGVDHHFRHESKLSVCRTQGLNLGCCGAKGLNLGCCGAKAKLLTTTPTMPAFHADFIQRHKHINILGSNIIHLHEVVKLMLKDTSDHG